MSDERVESSELRAERSEGLPAHSQLSTPTRSQLSPKQRAWQRFKRNRRAVVSAWYLLMLLALIVAWPIGLKLASMTGPAGARFAQTHDPDQLTDRAFARPNAGRWFGTDGHGRDVFSRVVYGARVSLMVGAVGAGVSLVIGVLWGAIAGFAGGRIDSAMMRIVDVLYSLPSVIFVIVLITTLGEIAKEWTWVQESPTASKNIRLALLFVGLGAVSWLTMARIVRGQVLSLRTRPFVEASRALGAGPLRILTRHIIPNVLGVVIVYLTLTVPAIILYESFLSYLGLGIQPPMASWGSLIKEGVDQINPIRIYWWLIAFPGAVLVSTLLALNFLGDGLRDAWDVRGQT